MLNIEFQRASSCYELEEDSHLKILSASQQVETHIIAGFLGAGKTTLLQSLMRQKPEHEVWAVLMNEFGQIGVDQQLFEAQDGFAIQELLGGCLCCSSQLPMQIALSRLLNEAKPDRLFIEPTGLGHPAQLLEQLTEPHWQAHLKMKALVTVLDGSRLHDLTWTQQNLYQDQLKSAQIVVVSHADTMTEADHAALITLKSEYLAYVQHWLLSTQGQLTLRDINQPYHAVERQIQPLFQVKKQLPIGQESAPITQYPYHYIETAQGYTVAGWKFSKRWQFNFYDLLDVLCEQKNWLRIKGIFHTDQGWMTFNFNPDQLNYKSGAENIDNRVEVISQAEQNCEAFETALLNCRIQQDEISR